MTKPFILPGKLTISRTSGGIDDDSIRIELIDESSSCVLVEIRCSPETLGIALTGMGRNPCTFEFFVDCPVGKKREVKHEKVFVPNGPHAEKESRIAAALAPHEIDGWLGFAREADNPHRWVNRQEATKPDGHWYNVGFIRFVEK